MCRIKCMIWRESTGLCVDPVLLMQVLQQRLANLQGERDALYSRFESSIYDVQQKTSARSMLLEKRIR